MRPPPRMVCLLLTLLVAGACTRPSPPEPAATLPSCALLPEAGGSPDTVTIGVTDSLDLSRAPLAQTGAERIVFGILYPGLARLDCRNHLVPYLADRWSWSGGRWSLHLRSEVRFTDGTPLTADRVAAAWQETAAQEGAGLRLHVEAVPDPHALTVTLDSPGDSLPNWLAAEALAPVLRQADGEVLGAGRYRAAADSAGNLLLTPRPPGADLPVIRVRVAPGADPRDLLDAGVDLLVSDDPATIDYARSRTGLSAVPLPWSRVYALVVPASREAGPAPPALLQSLAGDAVQVEARPVAADSGPVIPPGTPGQPETHSFRVLYPVADRTAAGIARRLVSLAIRPGRDSVTAWVRRALPNAGPVVDAGNLVSAGLSPDLLGQAMERGNGSGYVISYDRSSPPRLPAGLVAVPLIETRFRAIVRAGIGAFQIGGDGTVGVAGAP